MNDIYANIVITDIKTGEIIPQNRIGWDLVAHAYVIGWPIVSMNKSILGIQNSIKITQILVII